MITNFMVARRSGTSAAGINLPPVHGAQKGVDPTLKPESQSKSQQALVKPSPMTPGRKLTNPVVKCTPPQTSVRTRINSTKNTPTSAKAIPRTLLNTPAPTSSPALIKSPSSSPAIQNTTLQQTPVRKQLVNRPPISAAQDVSRKQRSVKLLHAPKVNSSDNVPTAITPPIKLFPSGDTPIKPNNENLDTPEVQISITKPKIPPQQALLPQENPFDINSELIPYNDREVEAVFKAPELDDFLLLPVLSDQITDSTLMHRYLPMQADIDRIMDQINRKYLTKLQLPCSIRDMQAACLSSPHFRDIYLSVGMNKIPSKARSARKLESDLMNAVYMIHTQIIIQVHEKLNR